MAVDIAFEVNEVSFAQFERRKAPRNSISLIEILNKSFLKNIFEDDDLPITFDFGIEVDEVPFEQFERRKQPR
ncbi:MAG: hypothetical protein ACSHWN_10820 [Methylophilaceae bacterium]